MNSAPWITEPPRAVGALVFDCDGLLVDTEPRWTVAEAALFARHGLPFGPDQKAMLIGRSLQAASDELAVAFGRPGEGALIADELLTGVTAALGTTVAALPGAQRIVATCRERMPIAVASNSPRSLLDVALEGSGLAGLAAMTLAADEVEHPKPAPDLFRQACARMGADPTTCVAFEDSSTGVAAARAAGLYVIVVPSMAGARPDHDWLLPSLEDPALLAWAESLTHHTRPTAPRSGPADPPDPSDPAH